MVKATTSQMSPTRTCLPYAVMLSPVLESPKDSGMTVIEFTVPEDRVGEWEMGCFEDKGTHYDDGMRGKVIVVSP